MTILWNKQLNIYILIQIAIFTSNILITIMYYMAKFWFSKLMQSQFHYNSLSADGSVSFPQTPFLFDVSEPSVYLSKFSLDVVFHYLILLKKMLNIGAQSHFILSSHSVQVSSRLYHPLLQQGIITHQQSPCSQQFWILLREYPASLFLSALYYLLRQHAGSSFSSCLIVPPGRQAIPKWGGSSWCLWRWGVSN